MGKEAKRETVQHGDEIAKQKVGMVLGEILLKAQEVGFELATLDFSVVSKCPDVRPLIERSRELIIALKRLFAMRRELMELSS